jgi:hypothetical protein
LIAEAQAPLAARRLRNRAARRAGLPTGSRSRRCPPAAQRLRNHGGWAGARVIAEPQVPPAAQPLRNRAPGGAPTGSRRRRCRRRHKPLRNHRGWAAPTGSRRRRCGRRHDGSAITAAGPVRGLSRRRRCGRRHKPLRNHRGWAGARVIAEAQVPPAAQPLRNDDSSAVTPLWERSQVAARRDSRPGGVADRPAAPRCSGRANECLWLRCRSG